MLTALSAAALSRQSRRVICSSAILNWFCRTTGYGGTTQRAHAAPAQTASVRSRSISIPTSPAYRGDFQPEQRTIDVKLGEVGWRFTITSPTRPRASPPDKPPTTSIRRRPASISKDQLLLLYRADAAAGRKAGYGGGILCRSQARQGQRAGRHQHDHTVLSSIRQRSRNSRSQRQPSLESPGASK